MAPYERLDAWRHCHQLALAVYRATKKFPSEERYGLVAQARRAAFSAAANIVEGSARRGKAQFRRFVDFSVASLAELGYIIRISADLDYLQEGAGLAALRSLHEEASRTTWGLYRSLSG
jgi:four helix bundle protein